MSQTLSLRPFDKLFVKDGRPLSLEDDSAASGLFPPPPSVFFGALRSGVLAKAENAQAALHTENDPIKTIRLTGFSFAINNKFFFPAPNDLVRMKEKNIDHRRKLNAHRLGLQNAETAKLTSAPTSRLLGDKGIAPVESVGGYITSKGLKDYFLGNRVDAVELIDADKLYDSEPKLGIGLDYQSGTTKDGLIYTMVMQRLKPNVQLIVQAEGLQHFPAMLRLGAEARAVTVHKAKDAEWPTPGKTDKNRFTLYLSSPAVFEQGWIPDILDPSTLTGKIGDATVKLIAASVGRYLPLGGWDIDARRPKPMRKAVPAGSVYHFEITDGELNPKAVHGKPITSNYPHSGRVDGKDKLSYQQQGFGIVYLGAGPQDLTKN